MPISLAQSCLKTAADSDTKMFIRVTVLQLSSYVIENKTGSNEAYPQKMGFCLKCLLFSIFAVTDKQNGRRES